MIKKLLCLLGTLILLSSFSAQVVKAQKGEYDADFRSSNDFRNFYDPRATTESCSSGGSGGVNVSVDNLPPETIKKLESENVKQKAEKNMERYKYAEKETKVPWQVLAAIHYREGGMDPGKSIADGSPLGRGTSKDGLSIDSDPNKDTANQARHFIENAKSVYKLDTAKVDSWSVDDWGNAVLAYNRGFMYKAANEPYTKSPYVMNYLTKDRIRMKWINADSYYKGKKMNSVAGKADGNAGALTVMTYLGYKSGQGGETSGGETCNSGSNSAESSQFGSVIFPLENGRSSVKNKNMFRNNTTDRGGHPYIAFDILANPGVGVTAFIDGTVNHISTDRCPGRFVSVYSKEYDVTLSYMHMNNTTAVKKGDNVKAGQKLGIVGPPAAGCGTPHLHIDAIKGNRRLGCSRLNCPSSTQKLFIDIGPDLFKAWEALDNKNNTGSNGGNNKGSGPKAV